MESIIKLENIADAIYIMRGQKVMFDFDLALLYGVETRALKQQVRRNIDRFPNDFMFELNHDEWRELITNSDKLQKYRSSPANPFAFTEQGVAMLSSVLKSKKALEVNIAIIRAFVELRKFIINNDEIAKKLAALEKGANLKFLQYDEQFRLIMEAIQEMGREEGEENVRKIGFDTNV